MEHGADGGAVGQEPAEEVEDDHHVGPRGLVPPASGPVTVLPRNTQSGFARLKSLQSAPLSRQMRHCW